MPEPEPVGWRRLAAQTRPRLKDLVIKLGDLGFKKAEVQEVWRFEPAETVQCDVIIGSAGPLESGEVSPWVLRVGQALRRPGLPSFSVLDKALGCCLPSSFSDGSAWTHM